MALLIPGFEPTKELPESKGNWQEIRCELVTPIYGGGVQAAIPDISMPIRATAILVAAVGAEKMAFERKKFA